MGTAELCPDLLLGRGLAGRNLQRVIEANFESCPFIEAEVVIGEDAGEGTHAGACSGADPG